MSFGAFLFLSGFAKVLGGIGGYYSVPDNTKYLYIKDKCTDFKRI